jgi:hypothetical protein
MADSSYQLGDLVVITSGEWKDYAGVVSWPITENNVGYVLVYSDGRIAGVRVSDKEIKLADETSEGFTQLTYHLIKLSSYLIEKRILPVAKTH